MPLQRLTLILSFMLLLVIFPLTASAQTSLMEITLESKIYRVVWSPDGELLAVGSSLGLQIMDSGLQLVATPEGHRGEVGFISWEPDSTGFATGARDGTIRIWSRDTTTNKIVLERTLSVGGADRFVNPVAWSPNGLYLAEMIERQPRQFNATLGKIRIWDTADWTSEIYESDYQFPWIMMEWSPNSRQVLAVANACVSVDPLCLDLPVVFSLDIATGTFSTLFVSGSIPAMDWQGDRLALSTPEIEIYDTQTMEQVNRFSILSDLGDGYKVIKWNTDETLLIGVFIGQVHFIDANTGEVLARLLSQDEIAWMDWHPAGSRLAIARENGRLELWDTSEVPVAKPHDL